MEVTFGGKQTNFQLEDTADFAIKNINKTEATQSLVSTTIQTQSLRGPKRPSL